MGEHNDFVLIITGPTAAGKSNIAIDIATQINGEIISADSRQVYKHLKIGTNVPTAFELATIKHHLIDFLELDQRYNAGQFIEDTHKIIPQILDKNRIPIIVGGTGFYIKALLEGINNIPKIPANIREKAKNKLITDGLNNIYQMINEYDPKFAHKITISDKQRMERWLEVFLFTAKPISYFYSTTQKTKFKYKYSLYTIYYSDRPHLYEIINNRVDKMIEKGLIEEAYKFLAYRKYPVFNTIGYKELLSYFDGKSTKEKAIELIKRNTRRFAKRQITFFKLLPNNIWLDKTKLSDKEITNLIINYLD